MQKPMAEEKELKLHGRWASNLCMAVELALKLKGKEYEYVQEDPVDKSAALLEYNPIHKKVPVLVHKGKPIAETVIIAQYIDETWKEPPLLPQDPYERARVRFLVDFIYTKWAPTAKIIFLCEGEEREKGIGELAELITKMEEQLSNNTGLLSNGGRLGLLDIVIGTFCCWLKALGEIAGVELVSKEKAPLVHSSLVKLEGFEAAKEVLPDHGRLVEYALSVREKLKAL